MDNLYNNKPNFINYVFNFDEENKNKIMNMIQYTLLAIIPVLIILKSTRYIFPEEDDTKGHFEILAESIGQIVLIILSIWFTNRIIHFIPTYSGMEYSSFNELNFIIPFLILLSTMQTKLGAKLNILMDRVVAVWNGTGGATQLPQAASNKERVQIYNQPAIEKDLQYKQQQKQQYQHQNSQADNLDIKQILPTNKQMTNMPRQQQTPDFNQMYQNNITGNPNSPGDMFEPQAANEVFGGSMFGGNSDW
jgi:hypothetical protein